MNGEINFNVNINENINQIKGVLGNSNDLLVRIFDINTKKTVIKLAILYISGLADEKKLDNLSLEFNQLINSNNYDFQKSLDTFYERLKASFLCSSKAMEGFDYETLYNQILSGNTIILIDGYPKFLIFETFGPESRSVSEPTSQTIVRGPKEGFTEKISTNISQLRRIIKDKSMKIENMTIGDLTKTSVAMVYLDQIAKTEIVDEVRTRLSNIQVDGILESGYIEEFIKDDPYSIFPTVLNSEKPDSVAAGLLEGKVAIVVDGTPFVLTVPAFFTDFLQVSEDYYHHFIIASVVRIIRIISLFLSLTVPAIYIALTTFHHEMIPTPLLISIASQREGVPFPPFFEAILMELTFEVLREAGIRMPRAIGSAISIVGALVLGQAAVQAGIISAVVVIIVSLTAITSFAIPNYSLSNAIRILRFIMMILANSFGIFGLYVGIMILVLHLSKLKSIGVPYLTPYAPRIYRENKDTFLRYPFWKLNNRPSMTSKSKEPRIKTNAPISGDKQQQELK
ncbi:MAG: spore germination protein [Clostridiales bacterium]|nr:spore germination protein [Clostridiales bacterium]